VPDPILASGLAKGANVAKVQKSVEADVAGPVVVDRPSKRPTLTADDYAALTKQSKIFVQAALRKAGIGQNEQRTHGEWVAIMDAARRAVA
jgi:hypothetical protein